MGIVTPTQRDPVAVLGGATGQLAVNEDVGAITGAVGIVVRGGGGADAQEEVGIATDGLELGVEEGGVVGGDDDGIKIIPTLFEIDALVARQGVAGGIDAAVSD